MGAGASTTTSIRNEYNFSGNNNGITSGDQGVYGTSTGASTDVKPTSDMNYSPEINPDFGGSFRYITAGLRTKLLGSVSKTPNLIDSARHIGSAAYRVAMGDGDLKTKALDLIDTISSINDEKKVLNGKEQLPIEYVKQLSDLQSDVIKKLPEAHDAYSALALGMTGMRNSELNTKPTILSLNSCFNRASEGEKLNAENIVATVGPRMGILPRNQDVSTSTIIQETMDNTLTEYGTVGELKSEGTNAYGVQRQMKSSILHANAVQLSDARLMATDSWETNDFIGIIKQHSIPVDTVDIYPGGFKINMNTAVDAVKDYPVDPEGKDIVKLVPTTMAFELTNQKHTFRDTYMILTGRVTVLRQPFVNEPMFIGLVYFDSLNKKRFQPVYYINTNITKQDHANITLMSDHHEAVKRSFDKAQAKDVPRNQVYGDDDLFSFDSSFQIVVNLSKMGDIWVDQIYAPKTHNVGPFKAMLCVGSRNPFAKSVIAYISVGAPSVRIETTMNPQYMIYNGSVYLNTILDLVGMVPEWYTTSDKHDPVYMYKQFIAPLIPYLGYIANLHLKSEGASLNLSREHIIRAFVSSNLPIEPRDHESIDNLIRMVIIRAHDLLSVNGPLAQFRIKDRKILMMHFIEKVINQSLTHIDVWGDRTVGIRDNYAKDCREFNAIELEMDKVITKEVC